MKLQLHMNSILFGLILFIAPTVLGQPPHGKPQPRKQKVEQLKIAFFTKELDLTTDQAEKFWPIYNEMAKKIKEKKKANRELSQELKDNYSTLSEEEVKKKTTTILDNEIEEAKLKKEYMEKIAAIIGYKKATKLLSLEARFKRELLNKLAEPQQKPASPPNTNDQ